MYFSAVTPSLNKINPFNVSFHPFYLIGLRSSQLASVHVLSQEVHFVTVIKFVSNAENAAKTKFY